MSFKKNKYLIVRKTISKELADFVSSYFKLKRRVAYTFYTNKYLPMNSKIFGGWNDEYAPGSYSHYGDIAMDTLLKKIHPLMEKKIKKKLFINYSYARIYMKGDSLKRHKDRPSCQISTTLNLGGDPWSIYLEPNIEINLKQGDMLIYRGCDLEHWRNKFKGNECIQVFLHYSEKDRKLDNRIHLGLPFDVKFKKI